MKKYQKIILLVLIFIVGFALGNAVKYYYDFWRAEQNVQGFLNMLEAPYKNDTYGGETPEATFDMYIVALEAGDLEEASKYFVLNKQEKQLENLKNKKESGELNDYIEKFKNARKIWIKKQDDFYDWENNAAYEYESILENDKYIDIIDPETGEIIDRELIKAGKYVYTIKFEKNYNIWKLYLL